MPAHVINKRLRRAGQTQWDVAERTKSSQASVSKVITRRGVVGAALAERIWQDLEGVLNGTAEAVEAPADPTNAA